MKGETRPAQWILFCIHVVLVIVGAMVTVLADPRERSGFAIVTIIFGSIALTVWRRSRWVILPGCLMMILAAVFTFLVTVGNIVWPESEILRFGLSGLGLLLLEGWAVSYVCFTRPGKQPSQFPNDEAVTK